MRTTITLSPEAAALLQQYIDYFSTRYGPRITLSSAIEDALNIALPIMFERVPHKSESPFKFLTHRAANLKRRITHNDLSESEVLLLMRESNRYQDDCRSLLLSKDKSNSMQQINEYQQCLQAFMNVYNIGANRLNAGDVSSINNRN